MPLLQRNLEDLIRGLRANKKNESVFIGQVLQEIKEELASPDDQKQMVAVAKLTYLQMMGIDINWASFNIIKVMSQAKFTAKRIGYLAASQTFHDGTDVIILATNLIRKDMTSPNVWEASVALNCLSNICTPDLARDLAADLVTLLTNSKTLIRKKACLVLYKVFLKFPDALRPSFPRLKEKLEDSEPPVVAAAVNVICELARRNPKNYISLAPILFKILTATDRPANNWVLIKIVKLFAALLPVEERLSKKLIGPLTNIMNTTSAMSLQYECIQTCTTGLADHLPTIKLCIQKLRSFVEDPDQNLKYLGLLALNNIMKIHPKAVAEHRDLVLNCLEDQDTSIRLRALDLLEGMVTKKNIVDIVKKLLDSIEKADNAQYKDSLVEKVVNICNKNSYQSITDFEWYISVLIELAHTPATQHGELIASQMMDVIIRVNVVRPFGVKSMISLLRDSQILSDNLKEGGACEVLYSAAWIVGEFASLVDDKLGVVESLLQPRVVHLPAHIQSVYMQSVLKIFGQAASGGSKSASLIGEDESEISEPTGTDPKLNDIIEVMKSRLTLFTQSQYLEVQERACFALEMLNLYKDLVEGGETTIGAEIADLFDEALNPVAKITQKKAAAQIPEGLDLDKWINDEPEEEVEEAKADWDKVFDFIKTESESEGHKSVDSTSGKEVPRKTQRTGVFYLSNEPIQRRPSADSEDIPFQKITAKDLGISEISTTSYKDRVRGKTKQTKHSRNAPAPTVLKDEDIEGGELDETTTSKNSNEPVNALDQVDLRAPLRADERLPMPSHRVVKAAPAEKPKAEKEKKKSKKHKEGEKKPKKSSKSKSESKSGSKSASKSTKSGSSLIDLGDFDAIPSPSSSQSAEQYSEISSPPPIKEEKDNKRKSKKETSEKKSKSSHDKKKSSKTEGKKSKTEVKETPVVVPKPSSKFKPLCADENLSVIYELRVSPKEGKKIMTAFAFKNLSQKTLSDLEFTFPSTLNMKVANEAKTKASVTMEAGATGQHNIIFDVQSIQTPQRVQGALAYNADGVGFKKEFSLYIPCSAFIIPVKLEKEQFFTALTQTAYKWHQSSVDVRLEDEFSTFVVSLAVLLHVELIIQEAGVSFYGKSVQGHEIAVYAKQKDAEIVHVDIKCGDEAIAKNLSNEVSNFFPRP